MEKTISEKQAQKELAKYTGNASIKKTEKLLAKEGKVKRLASIVKVLAPLKEDIKAAFSLVKDWYAGKYKGVSWKTIAILVGALIYLISPLDLIPDVIPVLGLTDDGEVLTCAFKAVKVELDTYKEWKTQIKQ